MEYISKYPWDISYISKYLNQSGIVGSIAHLCPTLCEAIDSSLPGSASLISPRDFPSETTRVGYHFLLRGWIFLTQGSNQHLWHLLLWQVDYLPLSYLGIPFQRVS